MERLLNQVARDDEGYLLDPGDWSEELAEALAEEVGVDLTDEHWRVVVFIRASFEREQTVPEARKVLKHLQAESAGGGTRRYLYSLFPYGYGQQACKIAGMRKPLKLMLDV